jgi:hypothetical protein
MLSIAVGKDLLKQECEPLVEREFIFSGLNTFVRSQSQRAIATSLIFTKTPIRNDGKIFRISWRTVLRKASQIFHHRSDVLHPSRKHIFPFVVSMSAWNLCTESVESSVSVVN